MAFWLGVLLFAILSATCLPTYFLGIKAKKRALMFIPPAAALVLTFVFLFLPMNMNLGLPFVIKHIEIILDIGISMAVSFSASLITIGYVYLAKLLPQHREKNKTHFD